MLSDKCKELMPFRIERPNELQLIYDSGLTSIIFNLFAATKNIDQALLPNRLEHKSWWDVCFELLSPAIKIFGRGNVGVRICLGLGETEEQVIQLFKMLITKGAIPLVATEVPENKDLEGNYPVHKVSQGKLYRTYLAVDLMTKGISHVSDFTFNEFGQIIDFGLDFEEFKKLENWCPEELSQEFLIKKTFKWDWVEAWETQKRRIELDGIPFDEDEIEEEGGSFYKMVAECAVNK